jgi:hypothetical protein
VTAHAGVFTKHGAEEWKPGKSSFLKLYIEPQLA